MEITEFCLDAETLAAWVDGGLTAPELARAQTHVAGCARCQAMVGTLVRINAAAPTHRSEASLFRWLGWLAPFAAAAAAVIIWVAIPGSNLDTRAPTPQPPAARTASPEQPTTQAQVVPPSSSAQTPARAESALTAQTAAAAPPEPRAEEMRQDAAAAPPAALDKVATLAEKVTGAAPELPLGAGDDPCPEITGGDHSGHYALRFGRHLRR